MIKIFFVGDVFVKESNYESLADKELSRLIKDQDISICNLEAPIVECDAKSIKKIGPSLKHEISIVKSLKKTGFNFVNIGNNHIYDYGYFGLKNTLDALEEFNVVGGGIDFKSCYEAKIINVCGVNIGILSFCEFGFGALRYEQIDNSGYAWINHKCVNNLIKETRDVVDVLILNVHAGVEDVILPLPEWRDRYKEFVDLGVDIVVGTHPHLAQPWEIYKNKYIFYSLGNFYFQKTNPSYLWNRSFGVSVNILDKKINEVNVIPLELNNNQISISKDSGYKEYIYSLPNKLKDDFYESSINEQVLELWKTRYKLFYSTALGSSLNWGSWVKNTLKLLFGKMKINNKFLYHNISIESHRWVVERAIKLIEKI